MSKRNKIVVGTSQVKPSTDRLSTVLQLAELLNDGAPQTQADPIAQENNQLLKEILGYVKGIFDLMQENAAMEPLVVKRKRSDNAPITAKRLQLTVQDLEDSYHKEHGFFDEVTTKRDDETEDEDGPPIEFNSVEYIIDDTTGSVPIETVEESVEMKPIIIKTDIAGNSLSSSSSSSSYKLDFPLKTQEELDRLEEEIAKPSSKYRRHIIETIHTIQGKIRDHRVTIRTFLRVIFHDTLLVNYTWKGFENKGALCDYKNLMTFLKRILVRWFPDDDLSDLSKCIQSYVKNVPARLKHLQVKGKEKL